MVPDVFYHCSLAKLNRLYVHVSTNVKAQQNSKTFNSLFTLNFLQKKGIMGFFWSLRILTTVLTGTEAKRVHNLNTDLPTVRMINCETACFLCICKNVYVFYSLYVYPKYSLIHSLSPYLVYACLYRYRSIELICLCFYGLYIYDGLSFLRAT